MGLVPYWASQFALVVKNPSANAGRCRDVGLIPGFPRSFGGGQGNPLQYSCLDNPMDGGGWQAVFHRVSQSLTQLKLRSVHTHCYYTKSFVCIISFNPHNNSRR